MCTEQSLLQLSRKQRHWEQSDRWQCLQPPSPKESLCPEEGAPDWHEGIRRVTEQQWDTGLNSGPAGQELRALIIKLHGNILAQVNTGLCRNRVSVNRLFTEAALTRWGFSTRLLTLMVRLKLVLLPLIRQKTSDSSLIVLTYNFQVFLQNAPTRLCDNA